MQRAKRMNRRSTTSTSHGSSGSADSYSTAATGGTRSSSSAMSSPMATDAHATAESRSYPANMSFLNTGESSQTSDRTGLRASTTMSHRSPGGSSKLGSPTISGSISRQRSTRYPRKTCSPSGMPSEKSSACLSAWQRLPHETRRSGSASTSSSQHSASRALPSCHSTRSWSSSNHHAAMLSMSITSVLTALIRNSPNSLSDRP